VTAGLRRAAATATAAAALLASGCGGGGADKAKSSLDEALGYLPADTGFALVASTDSADYEQVQKVLNKFPFGGRAKDLIKGKLESGGADYDGDVKPLLGNDVVIGVPDNASFVDSGSSTPFVLALEARDKGKLEALATKDTSDEGESEGYEVRKDKQDDTWLAFKDGVVVLSNDEDTLKSALKRRAGDDRLTEDDFDAALTDLPADAPVKAYVNLRALLTADPSTGKALKIKWVDHVRTLGIAAEATESRVSLQYRLRTDPGGLTEADLPLAAGDATPAVLQRDRGSSEIVLALRDPARVLEFAQAAGQAVNPAGFAQFETAKRQIGKRLGIDVDRDVVGQLKGDAAAVATIDGRFGVRAELGDAPAFEKTLAKAMDGLPRFVDGVEVAKPGAGESLYGLTTAGGETFALGVVDGSFVVATDAKLAGDVAARGLVPALGQAGAFVAAADGEQLANAVLAKFGSGIQALGGSLFTGPLGELASSASADTGGVTGRIELAIE
jgi:hypothetical protein